MEHPTQNAEPLKKYHSLCSLQEELKSKMPGYTRHHRTYSDSSLDMCVWLSDEETPMGDSGLGDRSSVDGDLLLGLERKIDKLNDMYLEQCNLLSTLKEELRSSKAIIEKTEIAHSQVLVDMLKNAMSQRLTTVENGSESSADAGSANSRARSLLNAIEARRGVSLDSEIRKSLVSLLQSDELKEQMVRATAESVRGVVGGSLRRDLASVYLPVLERLHRRLVAHTHAVVEQAFLELEDKSTSLLKCVHKTSGALRKALERHQCLVEATADPGKNLVNTLQCAVEEFLHKELAEWRQKVLDMFCAPPPVPEPTVRVMETPAALDYLPVTPPQPANPQVSIIDQMMTAAMIHKQIQDGDVNGSFESALMAGDLALVVAACRRADPAAVFAPPCRLRQPVLLSLVQQLATDLVHDTQLKCRYLEEAIISLDPGSAETRAHLPLVVAELRAHLGRFLTTYPNHAAARRVMLIMMAADQLLK